MKFSLRSSGLVIDVHVFSTLFIQNFVGLLCVSMSIYIWALEVVWNTTGYSLVNGGWVIETVVDGDLLAVAQ